LSITEVSRKAAVAPSALRYYERCALIQAGVKIGGRRHYPTSLLRRLSTIKFCQKIGFSLTEIAELLNGSLARDGAWRQAAMARRDDLEQQILELRRLVQLVDRALECDCHALCDCPHMGPEGLLIPSRRSDDGRALAGGQCGPHPQSCASPPGLPSVPAS
jgi:MerR family redox-sensitive transcriptional activator SoxR